MHFKFYCYWLSLTFWNCTTTICQLQHGSHDYPRESSKSREKERERGRDKERDRDLERDIDKERDRYLERDRDRNRERDKDKERSRDRDRERERDKDSDFHHGRRDRHRDHGERREQGRDRVNNDHYRSRNYVSDRYENLLFETEFKFCSMIPSSYFCLAKQIFILCWLLLFTDIETMTETGKTGIGIDHSLLQGVDLRRDQNHTPDHVQGGMLGYGHKSFGVTLLMLIDFQ